jgi:hypothetical protein
MKLSSPPTTEPTATCATCGGDGWVIVPGHACGGDDNLCPHTCPEPQWEPCPDRCPTSGNTAGTTANTVDDEPF